MSEREKLRRNLDDYRKLRPFVTDDEVLWVLNDLIADTEDRLRQIDCTPTVH
ncbi:MAG TPA: hypothetical protein VGB82_10630 [Alphaproteobacteria bacterium]